MSNNLEQVHRAGGGGMQLGIWLIGGVLFGRFVRWLLWRSPRAHPLFWAWFWVSCFILIPLLASKLAVVGVLLLAAMILGTVKAYPRLKKARYDAAVRRTVAQIVDDRLGTTNTLKTMTLSETAMEGVNKLSLRTPMGMTDAEVMNVMPYLQAHFQLVSISPQDLDPRAGIVDVLLMKVNPLDSKLDSSAAHVLNLTKDEVANPYTWLDIAVDGEGNSSPIPLFLAEGGAVRAMHAGMSGSGKSSIFKQQALFACMCPEIDVVFTDGKGSELGEFREYATSFVTGADGYAAFEEQLTFLEQERDRRAQLLQENKLANSERYSDAWNIYDDGKLLVWFWDELGVIMAGLDSRQHSALQNRLYGLLSVFRSLGIAVVFSSQTFRSDLLDTKIRDNCFDVAVGFKMTNLQEARYVGFTEADDCRPDLIRGQLLRTGSWSCAGQFAARGLEGNVYGKTYYLSSKQIRHALKSVEIAPADS
jgi:hypothetical protein